MSEWLNNLKAGDPVIVNNLDGIALREVSRVTPTQVILSHSRFKKSNGWLIDRRRYGDCFISETTAEALDKIKRRELLHGVYNNIRRLDDLFNDNGRALSYIALEEINIKVQELERIIKNG